MLWFAFDSLRVRLTVLIILAVLPLYAYVLLNNLQNTHTYNCTLLALFATGAIATIWVGSECLLLRWLQMLNHVSKQLAAGDLKVRVNSLLYAPKEIKQLAHTFNQMAASLEQQFTQLRRVETQLRRANARFQLAAAAINAIIYEWDVENRTIARTQGMLEVLGYQPEEAEPNSDWWLERIHPDDRERIRAVIFTALADGSTFELEYRILSKGNQYVYVWDKGLIVRNLEGQAVQVFGSCFNITERKQAEAEIRQLNATLEQRVQVRTAQLETANRELDAFSYSVSHDLRAPLRHIRGFLDALAQQLKYSGVLADPKVAHYIEVIQDSSEKMGQLIDGLLCLSRVGRQQLVSLPVNLRQLVDAAIALVNSETTTNESNSIEFIVGDLPTVSGDPTLLQQVFTNLIDNAVKFSCSRQQITIEIGSRSPNGTIFVKDNGVGFQMEYADQLFGAFQRLHSKREFKGTGIGLAIVQRIIHRHGGTIWAESAPNRGATFYFKLK